jgi:hypothetical protein
MKTHLSPPDCVDALDGALTTSQTRHLEECEACRTDLESLRLYAAVAARAAAVPEPSPLFWDHFSARVQRATADLPAGTARWPWLTSWRAVSFAGGLAAVILAMVLNLGSPATLPVDELASSVGAGTPAMERVSVPAAETPFAAIDEPWGLMIALSQDLTTEQAHDVATASLTAEAFVADLSPAEQKELIRLIKREMGGAE